MEIVNCDALEYLKGFEDGSFDLVVLDPDYQEWGTLISKGIIEEAMRVTSDTGNVLCFTKQPFDYELRNVVSKWFRREIIWTFDNGGAWCSKKMPLISSAKIYWLVKSKNFYFNPRTGIPYSDNTKSFKRKNKVFGGYEAEGKEFSMSEEGVWLRDHLHYNKPNSGKIPAKPKELIRVLLKCFCPVDGNVLDPFAGSGTIPLLAEEMNMNAYASEIDKERTMLILDKCFKRCECMEGE